MYFSGGSCGCGGNFGVPCGVPFAGGWGNNCCSNHAIILVLFILLVIVLGSRFVR